jgi:hypothetical protein
MCFGPFCYSTKLGAERAKLVQLIPKFVPRRRVVFFYNDCTRSTPFDPKLIFLLHFVLFGRIWTVFFLLKLVSKRAELVQLLKNFVPRNRVEIFRNERTRSTHWTLNSLFGSFRTCWVHLGPFCCLTKLVSKSVRTCAINAKVRTTKACRNVSP